MNPKCNPVGGEPRTRYKTVFNLRKNCKILIQIQIPWDNYKSVPKL